MDDSLPAILRIFIPPEDIKQKRNIKAPSDKAHYLISVLRSKKGDAIDVIDGKGKAYIAEIADIAKKDVFINVIKESIADTESTAHLILCQGLLKGEKMDMVIQKATELGVKEIVPLITVRCLVKETRKVKRWGKIAEEAAEQCGRAVIPVIHEPVEFSSLLMGLSQMDGFIFWEEGGLQMNEAFLKMSSSLIHSSPDSPIHLLVGPEGGFTPEEVRQAEEHGLIRTTLGSRILRAETAAIVSVALVQFLIEHRKTC
ncbi:MAG: 16S rRNA (uracil(1498)-N(3))-methyltransferase [Nitrospirae bacterium]|nr:16S rRNA (uracil(1498)-N(3))-methyltransferase [Nitrospirota bacterium]